jgi:hypothetical protein
MVAGKTGADVIWPADNEWTALTVGTGFYQDDLDDQNPAAIDLIGTVDSYSAGYWAYVSNGDVTAGVTNDAFMIRMRLRGDGGGKQFVWQALLDTDGNPSNVEWIFQLVQSGSGDGVSLIQTTVGGPTLQDIATADDNSWLGDIDLYSRWSPVIDSTDYHLDFAIPWNEFSTFTGVTDIDDIRAVLSTSTAHNQINKDAPLGSSLDAQVSNVLSANIPEPAVTTLLIGAGSGMIAFRRLFGLKLENKEDLHT